MKCEVVREQLPDYTLGTLAEGDELAVRGHLRGCGSCRGEAASLDQGVAILASAVHEVEPPAELKARVRSVLTEEWSESSSPLIPARRIALPRLLVAAAVVMLVGTLTWAVMAQVSAVSTGEEAGQYEAVLEALGGRDIRASKLRAAGPGVEGSVIVYDSHVGQSWAGVFVRAPRYANAVMDVYLGEPGGRSIEFPFPIEMDDEGMGVAWLDTSEDLSSFTTVRVTDEGGAMVGSATVAEGE
jgi:anti-sigma factor RsiW